MSIFTDFPDFKDVPRNYKNQIDWLAEAVGALKTELSVLRAQVASPLAKGQGGADGGPGADSGKKEIDLNQYPVMARSGRITNLTKHFATLGGEPSIEACRTKLKLFDGKPLNNDGFARKAKVTKQQAVAWTYVLKKRGWIEWSDEQNGLVLIKNKTVAGNTDT